MFQKWPQNKILLVLAKMLSIQMCFFASVRKYQWNFKFLPKKHVWEKSCFRVVVQKLQD